MPVAKLIVPTTKQEIPKLRVAAYCRVSSNSADQRNSFATQEHVYTKYIAEKQEWELVDIFADEGLSGMKADNLGYRARTGKMWHHASIPAAFLLSRFFGAVGVWNAFWITEAITAIISICVYYKAISQSQRSQSTVK